MLNACWRTAVDLICLSNCIRILANGIRFFFCELNVSVECLHWSWNKVWNKCSKYGVFDIIVSLLHLVILPHYHFIIFAVVHFCTYLHHRFENFLFKKQFFQYRPLEHTRLFWQTFGSFSSDFPRQLIWFSVLFIILFCFWSMQLTRPRVISHRFLSCTFCCCFAVA